MIFSRTKLERLDHPHLPPWPKIFADDNNDIIVTGRHETAKRATFFKILFGIILLTGMGAPFVELVFAGILSITVGILSKTNFISVIPESWSYHIANYLTDFHSGNKSSFTENNMDAILQIWLYSWGLVVALFVFSKISDKSVEWLLRIPSRYIFPRRTTLKFSKDAVFVRRVLGFLPFRRFERLPSVEFKFYTENTLSHFELNQRIEKAVTSKRNPDIEGLRMWVNSRDVWMQYGSRIIKIASLTNTELAEQMAISLSFADEAVVDLPKNTSKQIQNSRNAIDGRNIPKLPG